MPFLFAFLGKSIELTCIYTLTNYPMDKSKKLAFTMIELIIVITIVAILSTIWLNSYSWYIWAARDSERKTNMMEIKMALKTIKQKRGYYPSPWDSFDITNSWTIVAVQWKLNEAANLYSLNKVPKDPYTDTYYLYSVVKNKLEAQIAMTLENWDTPVAFLDWDYKTVSKNVLPSIVLATWATSSVEIHKWVLNWTSSRNLFIMSWWKNLPYDTKEPNNPVYGWENIDNVLAWWKIEFWQNSDYRSCAEISDAAKFIHSLWSEEYQISNDTGGLTNTTCSIN